MSMNNMPLNHWAAQADLGKAVEMTSKATSQALGLPFDIARAQYAKAVQAGFFEKSLIASARFEQVLSATEAWVYGPWARSR